LRTVGIPVYSNQSVRLEKDGYPFWLSGLEDQLALRPGKKWGRNSFLGRDDLQATLAQITDEAPVILMAHEPDIFPEIPDRVSLTLSGHTHGGQLRLFGYSPVVPSRYGNRYAYGHVVEENRNLIVSGGLGCSIMPARFGSPPEIIVVELG
jgi:predicted MPP superfamily phosphohydrolase